MEIREPDFFSKQIAVSRCYYFDVPRESVASVKVVCGGFERCISDYIVKRKDFPYHAIEFVVAGEGKLEMKNKSHALNSGIVFSYGPGIPHIIRSDTENVLLIL